MLVGLVVLECIIVYLCWLLVSILAAFGTIDPNFFYYLFITVSMMISVVTLIVRAVRWFRF